MNKLNFLLWLLLPLNVFAASVAAPFQVDLNLNDHASLERGLKVFMENCSGCHGMQYQRYNRVAADLGIKAEDMQNKYMFTNAKIGDHMKSAMPQKDSAGWFGAPPPDLTMVARVRGNDWIYSYLKSFYVDPSRPLGVNNRLLHNVAMPHVLQRFQGKPLPVRDDTGHVIGTEAIGGELTDQEYDQMIKDLTGFLAYSAEPIQTTRKRMGLWVLFYVAILFVLAVLLKREYWKDVQ